MESVRTSLKIYLAGKIEKNCWRHSIVEGLRGAMVNWELPTIDQFPVLERSIFRCHDYVGPYFASCDHGCFHGEASHGLGISAVWGGDDAWMCTQSQHGMRDEAVVRLCLEAIDRCDVLFAWLGDATCHGTLVEMGYARANGKRILLGGPEWIPDLWFAEALADDLMRGPEITPEFALRRLIGAQETDLRTMPYREYLKTDHWQKVRAAALDAAAHSCQLCNSPRRLEVHHRTYERRGEELPTDLIVLCNDCHARFHGKLAREQEPNVVVLNGGRTTRFDPVRGRRPPLGHNGR